MKDENLSCNTQCPMPDTLFSRQVYQTEFRSQNTEFRILYSSSIVEKYLSGVKNLKPASLVHDNSVSCHQTYAIRRDQSKILANSTTIVDSTQKVAY